MINLCKIGIHRPLSGHEHAFIDRVSMKPVYQAKCSCGKRFLVDSKNGWLGFKLETSLEWAKPDLGEANGQR